MGLCAATNIPRKNTTLITNLDSTALRLVSMNVIVQMSKNKNNQSKYAFIREVINSEFPKAIIHEQISSNANEKQFNLICDGKLVYSGEYDGMIQEKRDLIVSECSAIAKNKLVSQF